MSEHRKNIRDDGRITWLSCSCCEFFVNSKRPAAQQRASVVNTTWERHLSSVGARP
ncbi:hypothetical protein [Glycomyces paridis]|uniref:hypothetical protein n=1 Tax=Glycomyces paridis TaxID=2126555 RepID=UPI0013052225|nr:hypothetical protein [Glycomyces paridis]